MQHFIKILLLLILYLIFTACSNEGDSSKAAVKGDHVWKEQTNTINKAREVEAMILDSAENTRKTIEQQTE